MENHWTLLKDHLSARERFVRTIAVELLNDLGRSSIYQPGLNEIRQL